MWGLSLDFMQIHRVISEMRKQTIILCTRSKQR